MTGPDPRPVAARLPDGRHLIAYLDPDREDSPLRRALNAARHHQTPKAKGEPGEDQPGQTPDHAPR